MVRDKAEDGDRLTKWVAGSGSSPSGEVGPGRSGGSPSCPGATTALYLLGKSPGVLGVCHAAAKPPTHHLAAPPLSVYLEVLLYGGSAH